MTLYKDRQGEFPLGRLYQRIIYRAPTTKTRNTKTATIPRQLKEAIALADLPSTGYLFPSSGSKGHITGPWISIYAGQQTCWARMG